MSFARSLSRGGICIRHYGMEWDLREQDGTKGSAETTKNAVQQQPLASQTTPVWEAPPPPLSHSLVNDNDGLPSSTSDFLNGSATGLCCGGGGGAGGAGNIQKTASISSFPRSPSSVSRGYLSLTAGHSPNKLSFESNTNQSPKSSGFLTSRRPGGGRKPLLVRSEVSMRTSRRTRPGCGSWKLAPINRSQTQLLLSCVSCKETNGIPETQYNTASNYLRPPSHPDLMGCSFPLLGMSYFILHGLMLVCHISFRLLVARRLRTPKTYKGRATHEKGSLADG